MKKLMYVLGGFFAVVVILFMYSVEAQHAPMRRLASGSILVGNSSNVGRPAVMSGDATIVAGGAITITDVTVGADAIGDVLYKDAVTSLARLGIGSGGTVLQVADAGTAPSWAAPGESPYITETFGEGADKGFVTLQSDGTATDGTAGVLNIAYVGGGNKFGHIAIGDNQTSPITMAATGIDIAGDQADNEGNEIFTGHSGASGRPLVVGTDAAFYFKVSFAIGDIDGTDTLFCGWRLLEAHNAAYDGYNTYFGIGAVTSADPMALEVIEELNGAAAASTDTTDTLQDGIVLTAYIYVSAAGVATITHDAAATGTQVLEDAAGSAFTFDDGDILVPYCQYLEHNAGGLADTVIISEWEVGYGTSS
jgi:hypothetical protein